MLSRICGCSVLPKDELKPAAPPAPAAAAPGASTTRPVMALASAAPHAAATASQAGAACAVQEAAEEGEDGFEITFEPTDIDRHSPAPAPAIPAHASIPAPVRSSSDAAPAPAPIVAHSAHPLPTARSAAAPCKLAGVPAVVIPGLGVASASPGRGSSWQYAQDGAAGELSGLSGGAPSRSGPRYINVATGQPRMVPERAEECVFPSQYTGPPQMLKLPRQTNVEREEYSEFIALGHGGIFNLDLNSVRDAPWNKPNADRSAYFNYGFNKQSWELYCDKVAQYREEYPLKNPILPIDSDLYYTWPVPPGLPLAAGGGGMPVGSKSGQQGRQQGSKAGSRARGSGQAGGMFLDPDLPPEVAAAVSRLRAAGELQPYGQGLHQKGQGRLQYAQGRQQDGQGQQQYGQGRLQYGQGQQQDGQGQQQQDGQGQQQQDDKDDWETASWSTILPNNRAETQKRRRTEARIDPDALISLTEPGIREGDRPFVNTDYDEPAELQDSDKNRFVSFADLRAGRQAPDRLPLPPRPAPATGLHPPSQAGPGVPPPSPLPGAPSFQTLQRPAPPHGQGQQFAIPSLDYGMDAYGMPGHMMMPPTLAMPSLIMPHHMNPSMQQQAMMMGHMGQHMGHMDHMPEQPPTSAGQQPQFGVDENSALEAQHASGAKRLQPFQSLGFMDDDLAKDLAKDGHDTLAGSEGEGDDLPASASGGYMCGVEGQGYQHGHGEGRMYGNEGQWVYGEGGGGAEGGGGGGGEADEGACHGEAVEVPPEHVMDLLNAGYAGGYDPYESNQE